LSTNFLLEVTLNKTFQI